MRLYELLWWFGNLELKDLAPWKEDYHDIPGQLSELLREEKISIHRSDYGKVFISCPAFKKKNPVEEYIKKNPGCTASEIQEALGLNKKAFYDLVDEVRINRVREGRSVLHFIEETVEPLEGQGSVTPGSHTPEPQEVHSEPVEEPEDPLVIEARRVWENLKDYVSFDLEFEEVLEDLRSGGDRVEKWVLSQLSDLAHVVLEEFEEFDLEDLMERFSLTKKEAAKLRNELTSFNLAKATEEGTWIVK